ncbi:hypothetical protein SDC9_40336 [bioreactor metagenome]|uniref:Uncharacterized protein n=1 Tax=bioreactor metagenome TaxID=1076179 RepID=A0A644VS79_9ZZZZ
MSDNNSVNPFFDFFADGNGQFFILLGSHVFAENSKELISREIADVCQLGHSAIQFTRRKCRNNGTGTVVETRSNGAARSEQFHIGKSRGYRKLFFGNFIVGFFIAGFLHVQNCGSINTHIVSGNDFKNDVLVIVVFGAWQNCALKITPGGFNLGLSPNTDLIFLQQFERMALVSLEKIFAHYFEIFCLTTLYNSVRLIFPRAMRCNSPMIQLMRFSSVSV